MNNKFLYTDRSPCPPGHTSEVSSVVFAGIGDVIDIHTIKIPLEQVIALERKVRVRESQLRDHQLHRLRNLRDVADTKLANRLLHLRIVGIGGAELKRVRLLEQYAGA